MTRTAELADVVLPGVERGVRVRGDGHEQRAAGAAGAQGARAAGRRARTTSGSSRSSRSGWGTTGASSRRTTAWEELRSLSPMHAGMSWERLEELGGHPVAVPRRVAPRRRSSCTRGCGRRIRPSRARRRRSRVVIDEPPVDELDDGLPAPAHDRPPAGLVQHGRADRRVHVAAPPRRDDRHVARGRRAARASTEGERVRVASRRGAVEAPVRVDPGLRPGLVFMTLHFPDQVDTNVLTIEATRPEVGHRRVQGDGGADREARRLRGRSGRE